MGMEKDNILNYLVIFVLAFVIFYFYNQNNELKKQIINQKNLEEDTLVRVKYENEIDKEINDIKETELETRKLEMDKILILENDKRILARKLEISKLREEKLKRQNLQKFNKELREKEEKINRINEEKKEVEREVELKKNRK